MSCPATLALSAPRSRAKSSLTNKSWPLPSKTAIAGGPGALGASSPTVTTLSSRAPGVDRPSLGGALVTVPPNLPHNHFAQSCDHRNNGKGNTPPKPAEPIRPPPCLLGCRQCGGAPAEQADSKVMKVENGGGQRVGGRRRVPALDGLRGLAVAGVIAYHLNPSWLPGGYLGVDIFFVVSGFLIPGLLLDAFSPGGRAGPQLKDFWARRARRLVPALVALVAVVAIAAGIFAPDAVPRLRADIPSALTFVANWRLLAHHDSYFEAIGRPPLLQHLWS